MELEVIYEMLAKNILDELKLKKEKCIRNFFKNFSCKSSCSISEDMNLEIIIGHIKKLEEHKEKFNLSQKNKIATNSII